MNPNVERSLHGPIGLVSPRHHRATDAAARPSGRLPAAAVAMGRRRLFAVAASLWLPIAAAAQRAEPARGAPPTPLPIPLALDAPPDLDPTGYWVSEKFDGVRAVWDGHMLRFRSGLPVPAPDAFLAALPAEPLDGELWLARGAFEALSGTVRRAQPDTAAWRALRYLVFDLPAAAGGFVQRWARLQQLARAWAGGPLEVVPHAPVADRQALHQRLAEVLAQGGEGLVLRWGDAPYVPGRSAAMLKLKPLHDAEAVVIAHEPGRGRHVGRMGALRVRSDDGRVFRLGTGFTDAEREAPPALGTRVSYSHNGYTADGLPRFARYLRIRPEGW